MSARPYDFESVPKMSWKNWFGYRPKVEIEKKEGGIAPRRLKLDELEKRILMSASPLGLFQTEIAPDSTTDAESSLDYGILHQLDSIADQLDSALDNPLQFQFTDALDSGDVVEATNAILDAIGGLDTSDLAKDSVLNSGESTGLQYVFVDVDLPDLDTLLRSFHFDHQVRIVELSSSSDGVSIIGQTLHSAGQPISAIHILTHGQSGQIQLGQTLLSNDSIVQYQDQFAQWSNYLTDDADILFYGCDVAENSAGQTLIHSIATWTGADVAASNDLTGSADLGGDWELEFVVGSIESHHYFISQSDSSWYHLLDLTAAGGETLVHTSTPENQQTTPNGGGNVAMDDAGRYVVAWEDYRSGNADAYAKVYNADGTVRVAEFRVHAANSSAQDWTNVAMADNGNFVVTWSDNRSGAYETYMRLFNIDGTALTGETLVSAGTGTEDAHAVDFAADGSFVVTWQRAGSNSGDIYFQRYNASGVAQGGNTLANTTTTDVQNHPDVTVNDDGSFTISWMSNLQDGSGYGMYAQRFTSAGATVGGQIQLAQTTTSNQWYGTIDSDSSGNFVATWMSNDGNGEGIYARRFNASGTALGNEFQVNTWTSGNQGSPNVSVDDDGDFVITWHDTSGHDGTGMGVYAQQYNAAGAAIGGEVQVAQTTGNDQRDPTVAIDGTSAVIVWRGNGSQSGQTDSSGIFHRRFNLTGLGPQTFTVTNTLDDGSVGSLRWAITQANALAGHDAIVFNIAGSGTQVINLSSALDAITEQVTIDGTTQTGWTEGSFLPIVLDGNGGGFDGLTFSATADNSEVRGLVIRDVDTGIIIDDGSSGNTIAGNWIGQFNSDGTDAGVGEAITGDGMFVDGDNNTIGGVVASDRNVINERIYLYSTSANNNLIAGNFLGTDTTGNSLLASGSAYQGVVATNGANNNTIGGATDDHRNIIAGTTYAIVLEDSGTDSFVIQNNRIGLGADGTTVLGNTNIGIYLYSGDNHVIGGVGSGNEILDSGTGILVSESVTGVTIYGNFIGTNETGTVTAGNDVGVLFEWGANQNQLGGINAGEGNVITASSGAGVVVDSSTMIPIGNTIRGNSIYGNAGLGIDLGNDGPTANDTGAPNDADSGPNNLQNWAVLTSVETNGQGSLDYELDTTTLAAGTYTIDFYASTDLDGGQVEGARYLGTLTNVADGNSALTGTLSGITMSAGEYVTLVTTDSSGNSSEFSTYAVSDNDAPTFGVGDGVATTAVGVSFAQGDGVVLQPDGKVLVAGTAQNGSNSDFALVRYNADGTLDNSFGTGGEVITPVGATGDKANSVTLQPDGKIVVAGYASNGSGEDFALVRYNADGTLDNSFGTAGTVITPVGASSAYITSVTVQSDGKIVAGGYTVNGVDTDFALTRYNVDGTLDSSFGTGGKVITAVGTGIERIASVTVQPDGKIVAAGFSANGASKDFAVVRYNADGTLDSSFGTGGKVSTPIGGGNNARITSVSLQPDGKIVAAGHGWDGSSENFSLVRYNANGTLDNSFGTSGKVVTVIGTTDSFATSVNLQSDGKMVVSGYSYDGSNDKITLARYNADGTLDNSFGTSGIVITAAGSSNSYGNSATLQPDGQIVVAGSSYNGGNQEFTLVRYNADGTLDTRFDSAYTNTLDGNPSFTEGGAAVVLDADVQVFDEELSGVDNFNGATLTLVRNGSANADDVYSATGTLVTLNQGGNNLVVGATTIGSVTQNSGGTLILTFNGNATNALVNEAMQQIAYSNASDGPPASVQIDWTFDDGNTGAQGTGGALTATGSTTVDITAVFDVNQTIPIATQNVDEDSSLVLSSGNGNALSVSDSLSGTNTPMQVFLSVNNGTLTLSQTTGLSIAGGANGSSFMTIQGTESDINAALEGLTYAPTANYNGSDSLTITTSLGANLEGHYTFEGGNAVDQSVGSSQNGTLVDNATTVNDPERGEVLSLDGVGDAVQIAGTFSNPANVTLAAWVNLASGTDQELISLGDSVVIRLDESVGGIGVNAFFYDGSTHYKLGTGTFIAGTGWRHIAFSFDDANNQQSLYIDGQLVASANQTQSISYAIHPNTFIGAHGSGSGYHLNGLVDDARVYTRALSADEIAALAAEQTEVSGNVAITVNPVNDAPAFTSLNGNPTFVEGGAAVVLDANVQISDAELSGINNFSGATLTLARNGGANAEDALAFDGVNVTTSGANVLVGGVTVGTYTFTGGELTITIGANATNARVNTLMQNIVYWNSSDAPPASVQIDWTFDDGNTANAQGSGGALQATGSTTVNITSTNDAPVLSLGPGGGTYYENAAGVFIDTVATVTDADGVDFDGGVLTTWVSNNGTADDRLFVRHEGTNAGQVNVSGSDILIDGVTIGSFTGGSGVADPLLVTFNANADVTDVQKVVRRVNFLVDSEDPSGLQRTVSMQLTDGDGGTSAIDTRTENVIPVNDAPSGADNTITVNEDATYTFTAADFGFTDVDNDSFDRVWIMTLPGQGQLLYNGSTFAANNWISKADIDLGLLTFEPAANGNGTGYASFDFQVQDDGGTANGGSNRDATSNTITFNVTAQNDNPTVDHGGAYTINEGDSLSLDASGSTDIDGDTLTYRWDLNNDAIYDITTTSATTTPTWSALTSFGIDDDGVYTIGLQVDDGNGGLVTTSTTVTVNNVAPTLTATGAATIGGGVTYTLTLTDVDPGDDTISQWIVNWGDGTIDTYAGDPSSVTHVYSNDLAGFTFDITVSAIDEDGQYYEADMWLPAYGGSELDLVDGYDGNVVDFYAVGDGLSGHANVVQMANGNFLISGHGSNNVLQYQPDGTLVGTFVTAGSGGLSGAAGMDFGADGNLYVASSNTSKVLRFDGTTGAFIDEFISTGLSFPLGLTFGPDGNLYVGSQSTHGVLKFDGVTGVLDASFNAPSTGSTEDITFGPDGNLYVSSISDGVVRLDGTTGAFIDNFVALGTGGLTSAAGVTFGPDGNLYVSDQNSNAVRRYDGTTGAYIDDYLVDGEVPGPAYMTFSADHQVTITNSNQSPTIATNTGDTVLEASTGNVITTAMLNEGDPDDSGAELTYTVTADVTNGTLKLNGVSIGLNDTFTQADIDAGLVTYDHDGGETTTDSFGFSLADGGENGSTPATGTFNFTVTAVNDAPSGADNTVATVRDQDYIFAAGDFGFSDVDGDNIQSVIFTTLTSNGTLFVDADDDGVIDAGEALTIGQAVTAPTIQAGQLKFQPVAGTSGAAYDSFTFQVRDDGGTANGGQNVDPTPNTMTIDVNDAYRIEGNIFEDVNGDAQLGDAVLLSNVTVHLYQDVDDDGLISAADTLYATTTTDVNGFYRFNSLANDTYFVVVDSRTIAPSAGLNATYSQTDVWAEQTYGVAGAASGASFQLASGAMFGGRTADVSDDASSLLTAEHVTRVAVSSGDVGNIDAGFSFNAVTGVRDSDDAGGENRSVQGSLRQFVQNANAIAGANAMRFVPGVATNTTDGSGNWWTIQLTSSLPGIVDDGTVIDGTAFSYADGTTVLDGNAGQTGSGGTVGLGADGILGTGDDVTISQFNKTELEIVGVANASTVLSVSSTGSDFELHDLAIRKLSDGVTGSSVVNIAGGGAVNVSGVLFGVSADGTAYNTTGAGGNMLTVSNAVGGSINNNYFAVDDTVELVSAMSITNGSNNTVVGNELLGAFNFGISAYSDNSLFSGNLVDGVGNGFGIGTFYGPRTGVTIENNTVRNTTGYAAIAAGFGSNDTTIRYNIVHDNSFGIHARSDGASGFDDANNALFSMNSVYNNGDGGIDVYDTSVNDGVLDPTAPNEGIDHPIITTANLAGGNLTLAGHVGAAPGDTDFANARVEFFVSDGSGEGRTYLGFLTTDANGDYSGVLSVVGVVDTDAITATATLAGVGTSEFGNAFGVNVAPINSVPGSQTATEDVSHAISGLSVGDADTNVTSVQLSVSNGSLTVALQGAASISAGSNSSATLTISGTQADINSTLATLSYLSNLNYNGSDTLNIVTTDAGGVADSDSVAITINSANDAPVLDNTGTVTLTTQAEDAGPPVGAVGTVITNLVSLGGNVTDVDSGSQTGVAITAADTTHGTWWYTLDGGTNWNAMGSVSDASARVLNANSNTRIYFESNADFNGTISDAITFRAWDREVGPSGSLHDTTTNGGTTGFSTATETADLTVTSINDAPVVTAPGAAYSFTEQGSLNIHGTGFTVVDVDDNGGTMTATFAVGEGRLLIDAGDSGVTFASGAFNTSGNSTDTVTFTGTKAQINALLSGSSTGTIVYYHDQTASSDVPSASTTITLTVNDQGNTGSDPGLTGDGSSEEHFASQTIDITSANDAPNLLGANLIANGTFDTNLSGWTVTGDVQSSFGRASFGKNNLGALNALEQTIATVIGETYILEFEYRDDHGHLNQQLEVTVDGGSNLLTTQKILTDTDGSSFVRYRYSFTADSSSATLTFADTSDNAGSLSASTLGVAGAIDNIEVRQTGGQLGTAVFIEGGAAVVLDDNVSLFDAEINAALDYFDGTTLTLARNGGPNGEDVFSATGNLVLNAGTLELSSTNIGSYTNAGGQLSITFNASATGSQVNEVLQSIAYRNTSEAPPSSVQIDWTFNDNNDGSQGDGGALTATGSTTVNITVVNDAPVLDSNYGTFLNTITEDQAGNAGQTVASVLASSGQDIVTDVDSGAVEGIAVVVSNQTHGTWQYSLDGGTNWADFGSVSNASALLLRDTDLVRFNPDGQQGGSSNFGFRAWDQTSGDSAGDRVNITATGGTSAFSSNTESALISVSHVNDAPTISNASVVSLTGTDENTTSAANNVSTILTAASWSDVDVSPQSGIAITGLTGNGTWEYTTGGAWTTISGVTSSNVLLLSSTAQVRYVPDGDNGETAQFTFRAWDQTTGTTSTSGAPIFANPGIGGGTMAYSTTEATAEIVVADVNDLISATADTANAVEAGGLANATAGSNPSGNVLTNDTDVDTGDTKTVTGVAAGSVSLPSGQVASSVAGSYGSITINSDGSYTYNVDNNNAAVQALRTSGNTLTDTFTYTVTDGASGSVSTQVVVTIQGQNDAPIAVADTVTATEAGGDSNGTAGFNPTGNVLTNDTDVDAGDTKTVSGVAAGSLANASGFVGTSVNGSYGSIAINSDGSYAYTVDNSNAAVQALLSSSDTLTDTFTYTVVDAAGLESTTQITITIQGADDAPEATVDTGTATEAGGVANGTAGSNATGSVLVNDSQIDSGDTWTIDGVAAGSVGTQTTGTGQPIAGNYGTITINSDGTYTYVIDESNATVQALRTSTNTVTDTFTYTVRDAGGQTSTTQIVLTIEGSNDNPVAVVDTAIAVEAGGVANGTAGTNPTGNVLSNDTDVDAGDSKTVAGVAAGVQSSTSGSVGSSVTGTYGAITINSDGSYSYVVDNANVTVQTLRTSSDTLTDIFSYTVVDSDGATSTTQIAVTIQGANDTPEANDDTGTAVEAGGQFNGTAGNDANGNVLANDTDVDGNETKTVSGIVIGSQSDASGNVGTGLIGIYGTITLNADGTYNYVVDDSNSAVQSLRTSGDSLNEVFTYKMVDADGLSSVAELTITITGQNDTPTAVADAASAIESGGVANSTAGTDATGNVLTNDTDVDSTDTKTVSGVAAGVQATTSGSVASSVTGSFGAITIDSNGNYTYVVDENNAAVQALSTAADTLTDTFSYTVSDTDGLTSTTQLTITIHGADDAPVLTSIESTALAYVENDGAVAITSALNVGDVDDTHIESAVIRITSGYVDGEDILAFVNTANITGTWDALTGTLTLTGSDSLVNYQAALQSVTYTNNSDFPDTSVRTVSFHVNDGDLDSPAVTRDINIESVNDAPVNTVPGVQSVLEETETAINGVSISDVDEAGGNLTTRVQVNNGFVKITLQGGAIISVGSNNSAAFTLLGSAADINATLATLTYRGGTDVTGIAADTITLTTNDLGNFGSGGAQQDVDTIQIDITNINDEEVLATNAGATVLENSVDNVIDNAMLQTTDVDNSTSELVYTVTSVANYGTVFNNGVALGLNDTFTQADVDAGLIKYSHDGTEVPADSFGFNVDDGQGTATSGTFNISITPVNDQNPIIQSDGGGATANVNIAENSTAVTTVFATDADLPGQTVTYSLVGGADQSLFTIDTNTGDLTFVSSRDRENHTDANLDGVYEVTVEASDGSLADTQTIYVTITDIDEFDTTSISDVDTGTNEVDENSVVGTVVGVTASASDADATTNIITYTLDDDASGKFAIDGSTGVVTVAGALDYETGISHDIIVRATSQDGSFSTQTITIVVNDVNEAPVGPVTDDDAAVNTVAENSSVGTNVGITASAGDPDGTAVVSYQLDDDAGGRFAIDTNSGVVTVAGAIDREVAASYDITIRALSTDGSFTTTTLTIAISDVDEFDVINPVDNDGNTNEVYENAAVNTVVGVMAFATDADATTNTITYSLFDNDGGRFKIDATTGVVAVAGTIDREADGASRAITVRATSADGSIADQTFTINILDVDEFDVGPVSDSDANSNVVAENAANGTLVGITGSAADADATTNTIFYSLSDDAGGRFAIDSNSGMVTVVGGLDYESSISHTIVILATSADGSTSSQSFVVNLTDVNEYGATAISDNDAAVDFVIENSALGTAVGVAAFADDLDGTDSISYSLDDDSSGQFTIDSSTGIVTVAGAIDRETGANRSITVRATSTDGSFTTQSFTIAIGDVDEFDVTTPVDTDGGINRVAENSLIGTSVAIDVTAFDADATTNVITYSLVSNDGGRFQIDATTGVVTTAAVLDRETDGASRSIIVRATSADGSTADANFTILIDDVDEFDATVPVDTDSATNAISENSVVGSSVGITANSSDSDATTNGITYSLFDNDGGRFVIDAVTGTVTTAAALDRETLGASRTIVVRATSADGSHADQSFTINILDVDEFDISPIVDNDPSVETVAENAMAGTTIGFTSQAFDADATTNTISYTLVSNVGNHFAIDSVLGVVSVAGGLDYETASSHSLTVRATSADGSWSEHTFVVLVTDINEYSVTSAADLNTAVNEIVEYATVGSLPGITAFASDADGTDTVTYWLSDSAGGRFAIDNLTGVVQLVGSLDYELASSHTIVVRSTSTDGSWTDTAFTIAVIDQNDQPTNITISNNTIAENPTPGQLVGQLQAIDQDTWDTHQYQILGGTGQSIFNVDASGNVLVADANINFEAEAQYSLVVRATDAAGTWVDHTFTITVVDQNDLPIAGNDAFTIAEDNWLIGNVIAGSDTDQDGDILLAQLVSGPAHASQFHLNSDGTFTYRGSRDFNGSDSFQYRVFDGTGNSNIATVQIQVTPVNDAPVAVTDTYLMNQAETLRVLINSVLNNDYDVEGNPLLAILVQQPTHGTLIFKPDGTFEYQPDNTFFGIDEFTYVANDGTVSGNVVRVQILIQGLDNSSGSSGSSGNTSSSTNNNSGTTTDTGSTTNNQVVNDHILIAVDANLIAESPQATTVDSTKEQMGEDSAEAEGNAESGDGRKFALPTAKEAAGVLERMSQMQKMTNSMQLEEIELKLRELDSIAVAFDANSLWGFMDEESGEKDTNELDTRTIFENSLVTGSVIATAGYVLWTLRGGVLVATMMTSFPSWKFIDPLPVLDSFEDNVDGEDTESIQSMLDTADQHQENK